MLNKIVSIAVCIIASFINGVITISRANSVIEQGHLSSSLTPTLINAMATDYIIILAIFASLVSLVAVIVVMVITLVVVLLTMRRRRRKR